MSRLANLAAAGLVVALLGLIAEDTWTGRATVRVDERQAPSESNVSESPARGAPDQSSGSSLASSTDEPRPLRGAVYGSLRYADGGAASNIALDVDGRRGVDDWFGYLGVLRDTARVRTDGTFRLEGVPAWPLLRLRAGAAVVAQFELRPGEERRLDVVVPRGGVLRGVVVDRVGGIPISHCTLRAWNREWGETGAEQTIGDDGRFEFGWVPGGNWNLIVVPPSNLRESHASAVVPCSLHGGDVDLRVELKSSRPVPIRFTNVPRDWAAELPLVAWWYDSEGRLLSARPGNSLGRPTGIRSTPLDAAGRPIQNVPSPAPGRYTLKLVTVGVHAPNAPRIWTEFDLTVPDDTTDDLVVRLPDGAQVSIVTREDYGVLAIGPVSSEKRDSEDEFRFPRVPAGRHTIWSMCGFQYARVGEFTVPTRGALRYELLSPGTAEIRGSADLVLALRRMPDAVLIAKKWSGPSKFSFTRLAGGEYLLVTRRSRVSVTLADGQTLDIGTVR